MCIFLCNEIGDYISYFITKVPPWGPVKCWPHIGHAVASVKYWPPGRVIACVLGCSVVSDSVTPGTEARQAPLSVGILQEERWSGWPCPPPGDRPRPGTELGSPARQADSSGSEPPGKPARPTASLSAAAAWLQVGL